MKEVNKKTFKPQYPIHMTSRMTIPEQAREFEIDEDCKVLEYGEFDCPECGEFLGDNLPRRGKDAVICFQMPWGTFFWWSQTVCKCGQKLLISNSGV
jgi:hypothetical protein